MTMDMSTEFARVYAQAVVARPRPAFGDAGGFRVVAGGEWPAAARSAVLDLCAAVVDLGDMVDGLRARVAELEQQLAECGREAA